jgi:RND superfamily putative drug exporter
VTSAALILFFALASLTSASDPTVRQLASGMAAGVLLDAVVVRMLLLPAMVSLFGKANWWMPEWAARLLRLPTDAPKPAEPERIAVTAGKD